MYKTSTDTTSPQTNLAAFGPASERSSDVQRVITLDVILKTGKLTLHFTSHTVTAEGQYLESIHVALLNHEVGFIREQRRGYFSYSDEKKTHVEGILVMPRE